MSRSKGGSGEREIAVLVRALTGSDVRRRIRQHEGDSDIEGAPGWCVEVKRRAQAMPADVRNWWEQAARQPTAAGLWPVLFCRWTAMNGARCGQCRRCWRCRTRRRGAGVD